MFASHSPQESHLLAALPLDEYEYILPHLELTSLSFGDVLYESGGQLNYVYFPTNSIVSLLYVIENGASTEVVLVGKEGVIGMTLCMGGDTAPSRAVVQSSGHAYRLKGQWLKQEFNRSEPLRDLFLRYVQALMAQMAQSAVCNRHHTVDQQLCRFLLSNLDRLTSNELNMTQEFIANMLGVRREGITESASKLQKEGLIHYSRGHIHVLNRVGLEDKTCECYGVIKKESDRLLH